MRDPARLPAHGRLLIDATPLIDVLRDTPARGAVFAQLFERAAEGRYTLVITTPTLAEVLAAPLHAGDEALAERYRAAIGQSPGWSICEITRAVAHRAARIRARGGLPLLESLQVAAAIETHCLGIVTGGTSALASRDAVERIPVYG